MKISAKKAFAFDRDGTLIWGNPPGPIDKIHLLELRKLGYSIGGSGGQLAEEQYRNWKDQEIEPDFIVYKPDLKTIKNRYKSITHIGDDISDKKIAKDAGLNYMLPEEFVIWIRKEIAKRH